MMKHIQFVLFMFSCGILCAPNKSLVESSSELGGKIVGGVEVVIEEYPYQVSVRLLLSHSCGGSIISNNYVISAAHCFNYDAVFYTIRAGSSYRSSGGEIIEVNTISKHPDYNSETDDNDIAVLLLSTSLTFSESVAPIGLPMQNQEIADGVNAIVTGWGRLSEGGSLPTQLQAVTVPMVNRDACNASYATIGDVVTDAMICAGYFEGQQDACQGDSGGPLVVDGELIGIVSWGEGCAQENFPGVYSSVPSLRSFITEVTGF